MKSKRSDRGTGRDEGFTLVELLMTVFIIAVLVGLALPSLAAARRTARTGVCASNVRQLAMANTGYALENRDHYVLAAEDIWQPIDGGWGGLKRWHGQRRHAAEPFDPARGPLVSYLGRDGRVKTCPSFRTSGLDDSQNRFEAGAGGYGYNVSYVGGRYDQYGTPTLARPDGATHSAAMHEARRPAETLMFADAALAQRRGEALYVIEYSFCHPPLLQTRPGPPGPRTGTPSVHFRHGLRANVAWVDGHVAAHRMRFSRRSAGYGLSEAEVRSMGLGWFGPEGNDLFDLQ